MLLIIANIISLIGNILFTSSSLFKKKKLVISLQTINHFLSSTAQIMQKAYSGSVQDAAQFLKNLALIFVKDDKKKLKIGINIFFIVLAFGLGIFFNIYLSNGVWYGYLPVVSTAIFGICLLISYEGHFKGENTSALIVKFALILNGILWGTYGIFIKLYPITIFNGITIVLSIITITMIFMGKSNKSLDDIESKVNDND